MRERGAAVVATAIALVSPAVGAAPGAAPPAPGRDAAPANPPPPTGPAEPRRGFLASVGLGAGYLFASSGDRSDSRKFRGGSFSWQVLIGGHFSPDFSMGGAYLRDQIFGLHAKDSSIDGDEPDLKEVSFFTSSFGLFMDVRLLKRPELHLLPFIGYGELFVDGRSGQADNPTGPVFAMTGTTDFRVADHVALGVGLRLSVAPFTVTETANTDTNVPTVIPALLVTARYD